MEKRKVVRYRLAYEQLSDGTTRAWFKVGPVSYGTVGSIRDAHPDSDIREEE